MRPYVVRTFGDKESITEWETLKSAMFVASNRVLALNLSSTVYGRDGEELFTLHRIEKPGMALKKTGGKPLRKRQTPEEAKVRFHELDEAHNQKGARPTKSERKDRKDAYALATSLEVANPKIVKTKFASHRFAEVEDYLRLDPVHTPPNTYLVLEPGGSKYSHMMTIMPDDTLVAWSQCARCSWVANLCKCKAGVVPGRAVEYIYDQTTARLAGEEWGVNHPNYRGSKRHEEVEESLQKTRQKKRFAEADRATKPLRKKSEVVAEQPRKRLSKAAPVEVAPKPLKAGKPPRKTSEAVDKALGGDLSAVNMASKSVADDAITKIMKGGKKPLRKRGTR